MSLRNQIAHRLCALLDDDWSLGKKLYLSEADAILDLITAHPAPAVPEWQPIETAPRDGTHILVAKFDNGMGFGHSGPLNEHGFRDIQPWQDVAHWFDDGFYSSVYGVDQAEPFIDCTHWMPLPTPPKEAKGAVALTTIRITKS